jgi:hypothetical protein
MKGNRIDSQLKAIEKDLKAGRKVSPMQALRDYGCLRLSARIFELKHKRHLNIESKLQHSGDLRWSEYRLIKT